MLVKGIIEEKVDIYSYRVRIPFLNKVEGDSNPTLTEDLSVAAISTIPGIHSIFEQGDVVFIDFENDDFSDPVILGLLDRTSDKTSYNNIDTTSLNVNLTANLPYETYIGDITPFELSSLSGIKGNLQEQLSIQENTIETYMCEYGVSDIEEIKYQYGQKRAIFVKIDDIEGYKGILALTRIDTVNKEARFEGIVSDISTGLNKKIFTVVNTNNSWRYGLTDIVPPGLVWERVTNISTLDQLKTQLDTWLAGMAINTSRHFFVRLTADIPPYTNSQDIAILLNKSNTNAFATAIFTTNTKASTISGVRVGGMTKYNNVWTDISELTLNPIEGATTADVSFNSTNPKLTFQESGGIQPVSIVYSDYDSYRAPAGLKVVGNANPTTGAVSSPAWFEVEGSIYGTWDGNTIPITKGGTGATVAKTALTNLGISSRLRVVTFSGEYGRRRVVALAPHRTAATQVGGSVQGIVFFQRQNLVGGQATLWSVITVGDIYNASGEPTIKWNNFGNAPYNTSTAVGSGTGIRPCKFKYNDAWYVGFEYYSQAAERQINWLGFHQANPAMDPICVEYVSSDGSTTVYNQEILDSINFTATVQNANDYPVRLASQVLSSNRTTAVTVADSNYSTYMTRGEALFLDTAIEADATLLNSMVNGQIAWTYR